MIRRVLAGRSRFATALLIVLAAGVVLVVGSFKVENDSFRDLLLNLGATALGVFLTAIVLEPLIERARRPEETIHSAFPHQEYLSGIQHARRQVKIMGAWPYVMDPPWRESFLSSCSVALKHGVRIQILILDPLSHAAAQRRNDLDNQIDVAGIISDTLTSLDEFASTLDVVAARLFEPRVYSSLPPARLYSYDQRALCSFFPLGSNLGTDVRHYETNVTSGLARFVDEQFDTVWFHEDTRALADYMHARITVGESGREHVAQHVLIGRDLYVASAELMDDFFRNSSRNDAVRMVGLQVFSGEILLDVVSDRDPMVELISQAFATKYGGGNVLATGFHAVIRLHERESENGAA